ncbi:hypothetical protein Hanom_Chr06g00515451 [Helianthus anomalus]
MKPTSFQIQINSSRDYKHTTKTKFSTVFPSFIPHTHPRPLPHPHTLLHHLQWHLDTADIQIPNHSCCSQPQ